MSGEAQDMPILLHTEERAARQHLCLLAFVNVIPLTLLRYTKSFNL